MEKDYVGITANYFAPYIKHLVVAASPELAADQDAFERKLFVIRRVAELAAGPDLAIPSFSSRTIVYKGMLTATQLLGYYPDLQDERAKTALALVHSRFSTNTFPSWELAHPYRLIAHNGEINTLRGNVNWMRARESQLASELFGADLPKVLPLVRPGGSDSATFDNVLELLVLAGRSLPHALMMMVPEAWEERDDLPEHLRAFYAFHACMMEPWDGPAAIAFTDGRVIGATLDRNGLRPGRWLETKDGWVVLGSESGVLDEPAANVLRKGRLQPGKLFLVDLAEGRIVDDEEAKRAVATRRPYGEWYREGNVRLDDLPQRQARVPREPLRTRQLAFGYSQEDLRRAARPDGGQGRGADRLDGQRPRAGGDVGQRAAAVLLLQAALRPGHQPADRSHPRIGRDVDPHGRGLRVQPALRGARPRPPARRSRTRSCATASSRRCAASTLRCSARTPCRSPGAWTRAPEGMERAVQRIAEQSAEAIAYGANVLVLSDRGLGPDRAAIPSLLAVAAVHHHLVREGTRLQAGLVLESGEPREVHHFATLIGYGASAVNPYVMLESLQDIAAPGELEKAERNVVKAIGKGLLKTLSKMGISTIQSYNGAQIFEAVGLASDVIDRHFTGTASRIGGVGLDVLARETLDRHLRAYPESAGLLPVGGVYAWRRHGEHHQWNPGAIAKLQHAVRNGGRETYDEWAAEMNGASAARASLRGLLDFEFRADGGRPDRRGRAGERDRAPLLHGRDVARLALARGARDARHRHEPDRRQVEHRRGRRGPGALHARPERRLAPVGDQADRLGPLRRDGALPHERRRDPDQDGPGRQARRGRPAPGAQGRRLHRPHPRRDAGGRPDLAAAAPRHLLDRGPQAAHLRPALRQPERARLGQAGRRGRGRARWPPASPRPTPTTSSSPATTAAPARRRCPRSSRRASRGRSAWPRPSRRWCSTTCARACGCRPTAR